MLPPQPRAPPTIFLVLLGISMDFRLLGLLGITLKQSESTGT